MELKSKLGYLYILDIYIYIFLRWSCSILIRCSMKIIWRNLYSCNMKLNGRIIEVEEMGDVDCLWPG